MQAVPGGKPGPDVIARGGNNSWAPDIIRSGDKYFLYSSARDFSTQMTTRSKGFQCD